MVDISADQRPALAGRPRLVHDCNRPLAAETELKAIAAIAPKPQHGWADARQRRMGLAAMIGLGSICLCLTVQQRLAGGDLLRSLRTDGPFRTIVGADGSVHSGAAATAFAPGEALSWHSSFCAAADTRLMVQARLLNMADDHVVLYVERTLPADDRGCTEATWSITIPAATLPGRYQVQRFLLLTPPDGMPRTRILPPLSLTVQTP